MPTFPERVAAELTRARGAYPTPMHGAHEGYAILAEEVDELWALVKEKQAKHRHSEMTAELVQIAAMAQRMAEDVCHVNGIRPKDCTHPAWDDSRLTLSNTGLVTELHCPDCGAWYLRDDSLDGFSNG